MLRLDQEFSSGMSISEMAKEHERGYGAIKARLIKHGLILFVLLFSGCANMPDLNGFWLGSSLRISPLEQVQVLKKIFEGESIYSAEHVAILKEIMLVSEDAGKIYGKTGSSPDGEAWFVGFTEENDTKKYFAIYLNDNTQLDKVSGSAAKEIALEILE